MNTPPLPPDHDCVDGWAEILHRRDHLPVPWRLSDLSSDQYFQVGSNIPLQEFSTPLEIYRQFADCLELGFRIPRALRAFDALNLYSDELNRIVTLVLVPKEHRTSFASPESHVQEADDLPLTLINRPEPFDPFTRSSI